MHIDTHKNYKGVEQQTGTKCKWFRGWVLGSINFMGIDRRGTDLLNKPGYTYRKRL